MSTQVSIKRILVLCSRLDMSGGIERSVVNISNLLSDHGHQVFILVLDEVSTVFYPLHDQVKVYRLNLRFGITEKGSSVSRKLSFGLDVLRLRQFFKTTKPDVILSTEYPFTVAGWLAGRGLSLRLFSREAFHFHGLAKSAFWKKLIDWIYPKLDAVICLNRDEEVFYKQLGCRTVVIPNYIRQQNIPDEPRENLLLTVGRLSYVKGADMITAIAEKVFQHVDRWLWLVIGDGDLEEQIRRDIHLKNLSDKIQLIPPTGHDLSDYYRKASLYVSTSRMEGFPNVLMEAMSQGLPCIAFDCPTGPRHLIDQDVNGVLVPTQDITSMSQEIISLIENPSVRMEQASNAKEKLTAFSPEKIYAMWEQLLTSKITR